MNRNRARRCLAGIDRLLVSQVWTGTPFWMVRSRLWRQANLTLPDRVEVDALPKTQLQAVVDQYATGAVRAQRLPGDWSVGDWSVDPAVVVTPYSRGWLRLAVNESWFVGVNEIVSSTADVWEMRVNLHTGTVVWQHGHQTVAVLAGLHGAPERVPSLFDTEVP